MNRFYRSLLLTGILAAGLAGCGDDVTVVDPPAPPPPPPPQVRAVTVTPDNVTVNPGQTIQMTANVTADAGATPTVTWSTSDATRATVSNTGLVTIPAAAPTGPVAIRATATANGSTASGAATLNVVGTTVTGVTVTPATATINTSQTLQATATVTGTNNPPQTVNWTSLSPAVATVSATGLVTANATTGGNAVITACSTANPNICGTLAVTVVVPSPATVSIQSVTFTNGAGNQVPVVLTNVFGQIEVTLNVDNGSKTLTRVDALIGGTVVASQSFSSAPVANASAPELQPQVVTLSVNTAQLRQNGGIFVPVIFNGNSAITANLFVVGSATPIASNAIPVVMNNPDALVATSSRTLGPTSSTPSAVVGANTFFKGTQTVSGFHYAAFGKAVPASVTLGSTLCGASASLVPTGATATSGIALAGIYTCAGVEGSNTVAAPITTAYAAGAVGPDGTPLVAPAGYATVGSAFQVNNENRWNMIVPAVGALSPTSFIDNLAPTVTVQSGAVGVGPAVAFNDAADQQWVNASYAFSQDITASDGGSGVATGFPQARDYSPGVFVPVTAGCSATVVTTGADYNETLTSISTDGKRICSYAEDRLGNAASSGPSNYFGVDKVAPAVRLLSAVLPATAGTPYSGSATANTTIYSIAAPPVATDVFGVEALDSRSGFDQGASVLTNFPATMSLTAFNALGTIACNMGPVGGLAFPDPFALLTVLNDTYVRSNEVPILCAGGGLTMPAYVTFNGNATDRAGNAGTAFTRNFAADHLAAPNITGIGFAAALYTPGGTAPFGFSANDDLEVIDATVAITMAIPSGAGTALRYPLGSLSPLGTRWDNVITNVVNGAQASIDYFLFRIDETCSAAATPYASCPAPGGPPAYITAPKTTATGDYSTGAVALPTAVSANVADVASQTAAAPIGAPFLTTQFNPSTGIGEPWTAADLISWGAVLSAGNVIATHVASTSIVVPFFDRVSLWRLNTANEWVRCGLYPNNPGSVAGTNNPLLTDNGVHRFWTYTLAAPTTGPCTGATFAGNNYRALGVKAGAGLFTPTIP